mmetsp:Transcript_7940/g.23439  ORF Transcript_7940/g.23439 Transcript_7940/m.23439 type:complete len:289 (+) Transcript_7940:465-1331(+)|eukprot:CAMPEP_0206137284 /NCGR_PEP_ID=MMETSP1473-20131121/2434_1 /ASSEMBLY_ACC=CAM_ASM_001109 /TAXON_ID=1461547 /ORGANISM="Stichococcus sp, Strain RCC1054" /LENGTH=288 /DNA_ID=CAMNT_0053530295 /DNA_START=435 /DNA_END=1301 /DNA_ORIENTATION=-
MSGNPKPTRRAASDSAAVLNGNGYIAERAAAAGFAAEPPVSPLSPRSAAKAEKRTAKAAKEAAAAAADPEWPPVKTTWRGVMHQHAALAALTAGIVLVASAPTARAKIGCGIYAASLTMQLACSALYHVPAWGRKTRTWLRRLDHAAIFALIAGTYTPLCMLALDQAAARRLLLIEWGAAAVGIVQTLFWLSAPKQLKTGMYIFLGWVVLPYAGEMKAALGSTGAWLIAAGGVTYTVGGTIYAMRWPNPWPKTFGYHELFHCATILASIFHFTAVYRMVHYPGPGAPP